MSSDKRRRARVQGGWAAPATTKGRGRAPTTSTPPRASTCTNAAPAWLGKTVDCPNKPTKFVYEEPEEVICHDDAQREPHYITVPVCGVFIGEPKTP